MSAEIETGAITREGDQLAAGDPLPAGCDAPIEVRVPELRSLFNAIDPAPFNDRDLDPSAEAFIVNWSKDLPRDAPLALLVHLDRPSDLAEAAAVLREGVAKAGLPEDALVAGELELVLAHLAGLIDRVITPEVDSESRDGDDVPWP